MGIRLYCGINERQWNHHPVAPGPYACVAPVYGTSARTKTVNSVYVPSGAEVIQDSGAFSDNWTSRLTFDAALDRQLAHAERYAYAAQITHRASYDLLIDEVWEDGNRHKRRWTESAAGSAVDETVAAAEYAAKHRQGGLILSAQGVTARQYLSCVDRIVPLLETGDILGLGGWCVIGKWPTAMMPVFRETIRLVVPSAAARGVKRMHIWGVIYPRALGELLWLCDACDIALSTDSAGPSVKPCMGEWGYGDWRDRSYRAVPAAVRGLERARHVAQTRAWLECLEATRYYRQAPEPNPKQLELFGN